MATREEIAIYLCIRDNIEITVNAILNNIVSIDTILKDAENTENCIIKLTVKVVQEKEEYLKNKSLYEKAINEYAKTKRDATTAYNLVKKYGLNCAIFKYEIYNHLIPGQTYVYTRIIEGEGFTYAQDESIWQYLKWMIDANFISCTCRTCILLQAAKYAYIRSQQWKIKLYEHWILHETAPIRWVQRFEMRHRSEISSLCSKLCKKSCRMTVVDNEQL
ncbi:hypothetical protein ACFW04_000242 [Cataglyphis niger]